MDYVPATDRDRAQMLEAIGVNSIEGLFEDIPEELRFRGKLNIPAALSEPELMNQLVRLSEANADLNHYVGFLGAGAYEHYVPAVVNHVLGRSEFYTAYTPYQAEVSQGVLQAIYEYQSLICALTGMDVSNASMYDGPTAVAEAGIMACGATRRNKILVPQTVHPEYRNVIETYLASRDFELKQVGFGSDGRLDLEALEKALDDSVAGVVVQQPNFFGVLEDVAVLSDMVHKVGALYIAVVNPISLGILVPPSECGADIVVGEGQPFGNTLSYGGPYLGFMATSEKLTRRMPGRIVGATVDHDGNRGYVLTLQTREQHIRRERATSNICSNQALNALAATVYLTAVGKSGIREVAELCLRKAHYAEQRLRNVEGIDTGFSGPFFHEFVVKVASDPLELTRRLLDYQIVGGLPLGRFYPELSDSILFCVTETKSREDIDRLAKVLEGLV